MIEDWRLMISGEQKFEESDHFLFLFGDPEPSDTEIDEIFSTFKKGDELKRRYWTFQNSYNKPDLSSIKISDKQIIHLTQLCIKEDARMLNTLGHTFLNGSEDFGVKFINKESFNNLKVTDTFDAYAVELIHEYFLSSTFLSEGEKTRHISKAFLGLSSYLLRFQWFLELPIMDTDYNPDFYFDLRRSACDYLIVENGHEKEVLICNYNA